MNKIITEDESAQDIIKRCNLRHIAIIMDGNRRWASVKNVPSMLGHKEGVSAFKKTVLAANDLGLKYLTVYAFSTENWGRKPDEVDFLMKLLAETVKNEIRKLHEKNVKVRIIGDLAKLSTQLQDILREIQEYTSQNTGLNLQIAINYGSRSEITNAIKLICNDVKSGKISDIEQINDSLVGNYLYTVDVPDPDLLIRTGGENRISNYLLWQIAYTELYITDMYWPEFGEDALKEAIFSFAERNRRFGRD